MFPDANTLPASFFKKLVRLCISQAIHLYLVEPESSISLRMRPVLSTAMPKTAVYEHSHTFAGEHDIRFPSDQWQRAIMNSKPETSAVEFGSQRDLRECVMSSLPTHAPTCRAGLC